MADKHFGCYVCGGGNGEVLISVSDYQDSIGKALCRTCFALPAETLRHKFNAIAESVRKAREAAANG